MEKTISCESVEKHLAVDRYFNCVLKERLGQFGVGSKFIVIWAHKTQNFISMRPEPESYAYCEHYDFQTRPFLKRKMN